MTGLFRKREYLRADRGASLRRRDRRGRGERPVVAYNLAAQHGVTRIAVFERNYIGSGASGRNTQVLRANYNTPETVPLYQASLGI